MLNWCSTSYAVCSSNKQILQQICDAIKFCASTAGSSNPEWTGDIFKKLDIKGGVERTFWYDGRIEDGVLKFLEDSAWSRGGAITSLQESYLSKEDETELDIYFISEEPGHGIYEKNDEEGLFFPERYILSGDDGVEYYNTFENLIKEVQDLLGVDTPFNNVSEINDALEEAEEEIGSQQVHEFEIVNLD